MKIITSLGITLGLILVVSACASVEEELKQAGATPMSASEIRGFVVNQTAYGTSENGSKFVVYYDPSGEIRGKSSGSRGSSDDTGIWEATADHMLCLQFKNWRDGAKRCWQIYNEGGAMTWVGKVGPAKSGPNKTTWKDGNVENL